MPFIFDHTRTVRSQLDEIGVDWDCIRDSADQYDCPETTLVQLWLDLYGSEPDQATEPEQTLIPWEEAVLGFCQEGHSADEMHAAVSQVGWYDPYGEYGGREWDAAAVFAAMAEVRGE